MYRILDEHFSQIFFVKIIMFVWKKRPGMFHFLKKNMMTTYKYLTMNVIA